MKMRATLLVLGGDFRSRQETSRVTSHLSDVMIWAWQTDAWHYHLWCILTCSFALGKGTDGNYRWKLIVLRGIELISKIILFILRWNIKIPQCQTFLSKTEHWNSIPAPTPMTFYRRWSEPNGREWGKNRFQILLWNTDVFQPHTPPQTALLCHQVPCIPPA